MVYESTQLHKNTQLQDRALLAGNELLLETMPLSENDIQSEAMQLFESLTQRVARSILVKQARVDFRAGRSVKSDVVRPVIWESWIRSQAYQVNPNGTRLQTVSEDVLVQVLHANNELLESATMIMEKIFVSISAARSLIGLVDRHGLILHSVGCKEDLARLAVFTRGYYATEETVGTNGLGTCLVEQRPIEILGCEHYLDRTDDWCCAAAPIFDSDQRLAGVINVSIAAESYHYHTLGLVEAAAYAISEQLRLRNLLKQQRAMLECIDEGLIILDGNGDICSMNTKARSMLQLGENEVVGNLHEVVKSSTMLDSAISARARFTDQETLLQVRRGTLSCTLSCAPIAETSNIILTMRETKRMREYATRTIGARAVYTFENIVGESTTIREVVRLARVATQSDITTLILGESGTGKELFAQAIHNASSRCKGPFVVVNCGALPRNLVESELFGYDEGAFTGASRMGKPGKFELADGGTIFLDEIGEMPLDAQASLLRLLQEGELTRVGSGHSRRIDIRVIAATNKNLHEEVRQNAFRDDLFYRLNVLTLQVPPLRQRRADIRPLCQQFLHKFSYSLGKSITSLSEEAFEALSLYHWPGNVRELENIIERTVNVCSGASISVTDLPAHILQPFLPPSIPCKIQGVLKNKEFETILETLRGTRGNMRVAAQLLGIARSALYRKVKSFGLSPDFWRHQ